MAALASLPPGEAMTASALSEFTEVPVHYLSKIMRRLVIQKLVAARKGPGGGFALGRPARKITFADILAANELDEENHKIVLVGSPRDIATTPPDGEQTPISTTSAGRRL